MIRLIWPDIKAALAVGHTLNLIHERIVESNIRISYPLLRVYASRLRREESAANADKRPIGSPTPSLHVEVPTKTSAVRNPLANYEEGCIKNPRPHLEPYSEPDVKKLIG